MNRLVLKLEVEKITNLYTIYKKQTLCKISTHKGNNKVKNAILGLFNIGKFFIMEILILGVF